MDSSSVYMTYWTLEEAAGRGDVLIDAVPHAACVPRRHRRERGPQRSMQSPVSPSFAADDWLDPPERQESYQLKFGFASIRQGILGDVPEASRIPRSQAPARLQEPFAPPYYAPNGSQRGTL